MKIFCGAKQSRCYIALFTFLILSVFDAKAQSRAWPVPASAVTNANPYAGDANSVTQGKALYASYCSPCHGKNGKGDGPAAAALNPKPANHTSLAIQQEADGSLFFKISEGRTPMPTYKSVLTPQQRWALVNYIKTLGKK